MKFLREFVLSDGNQRSAIAKTWCGVDDQWHHNLFDSTGLLIANGGPHDDAERALASAYADAERIFDGPVVSITPKTTNANIQDRLDASEAECAKLREELAVAEDNAIFDRKEIEALRTSLNAAIETTSRAFAEHAATRLRADVAERRAEALNERLWNALVVTRRVDVDLSWWCHGEECTRRWEFDDHHDECKDTDACDGKSCWKDVECDCGVDELRDRIKNIAMHIMHDELQSIEIYKS